MRGAGVRVYTYDNIPLIHISAFASVTRLSYATVRGMMVRHGGEVEGVGGARWRRPLKYFRDGSTVWIPVAEVTGYPIVKGDEVYHYTEDGERYLCEQCTYGAEQCKAAKVAAGLEMPVGDP